MSNNRFIAECKLVFRSHGRESCCMHCDAGLFIDYESELLLTFVQSKGKPVHHKSVCWPHAAKKRSYLIATGMTRMFDERTASEQRGGPGFDPASYNSNVDNLLPVNSPLGKGDLL